MVEAMQPFVFVCVTQRHIQNLKTPKIPPEVKLKSLQYLTLRCLYQN